MVVRKQHTTRARGGNSKLSAPSAIGATPAPHLARIGNKRGRRAEPRGPVIDGVPPVSAFGDASTGHERGRSLSADGLSIGIESRTAVRP